MALGALKFIRHIFNIVFYYIECIIFHLHICFTNFNKLILYLVTGTRTWIFNCLRLILFVLILTPGWYKLLKYWLFSPLVIRNIKYGKGAKFRNLLDIYLPIPIDESDISNSLKTFKNNLNTKKHGVPVVVFVSGGAWIIGYKLWSALVARGLAHFGVLTIVPDYRNFPQGNIEDMMEDIRQAMKWTVCNAHRFGGDADKIVLSGQSAGAHITLCLLIIDFLKNQERLKQTTTSSTNDDLDILNDDETTNSSSFNHDSTKVNFESNNNVLESSIDHLDIDDDIDDEIESSIDTSECVSPILKSYLFNEIHSTSSTRMNTNVITPNNYIVNDNVWKEVSTDNKDTVSSNNGSSVGIKEERLIERNEDIKIAKSSKKLSHRFCVVSNIKLFIGVSGPYNLLALVSHLHKRGLDSSIINWICKDNIANYSPTTLLENYINDEIKNIEKNNDDHNNNNNKPKLSNILKNLIPISLFHGSKDATIPVDICIELYTLLKKNGAEISSKIYNGWSHTDAILEAPLSANMSLFHDMTEVIFKYTNTNFVNSSSSFMDINNDFDTTNKQHNIDNNNIISNNNNNNNKRKISQNKKPPMVSKALIEIARDINPF